MRITRRQLLAATASTWAGVRLLAQGRHGNGPKPRTTPAVCLYSKLLIKIPYDELGPVLQSLGADGCDLSVERGGHVVPEQAPVDLMRAVEAITGVGLDVPVISTNYTSLQEPTVRNVAAIAGEMGIPLMRAGTYQYPAAGDLEPRLAEVQRDIAGLAALARAVNMAVAFPNVAGDYVGDSTWDLNMILRNLDPGSAGYAFDPGQATAEGGVGGWMLALRLAQPRLKMVTLRDFTWTKDSGNWKMTPCPLGEGMVDWSRFFGFLAKMRFVGPISIQMDYQPKDELSAIKRDIAFVRKQLGAVYS